MNNFKISAILLIIAFHFNANSQDYFVVNEDTTFCNDLKYAAASNGYLAILEYTKLDGEKVYLKGKKKVPDVSTFYIDERFIDKVPLKADKPDSYVRYNGRLVDGALKVYQSFPTRKYTSSGSYLAGTYRFIIKMPDGTYYKIDNKKNMNKHIKPFLLECSSFANNYKGDFSWEEKPFTEMIELYNSLCN